MVSPCVAEQLPMNEVGKARLRSRWRLFAGLAVALLFMVVLIG